MSGIDFLGGAKLNIHVCFSDGIWSEMSDIRHFCPVRIRVKDLLSLSVLMISYTVCLFRNFRQTNIANIFLKVLQGGRRQRVGAKEARREELSLENKVSLSIKNIHFLIIMTILAIITTISIWVIMIIL